MKYISLTLTFILLVFNFSSSKNLTKLSTFHPKNFELLDVYIHNNYAFIPGGLGGLNIIDISNPVNTAVVGNYSSSNCNWGRLYSWSVAGDYAFGAGRECGIEIINISDISNPTYFNNIGNPAFRYEHTETQGNYLYAAIHQAGIEIFSLTNPQNPSSVSIFDTENAWAVLPMGNILYVADGSGGIKIIDISKPSSPTLLSDLRTTGSAKDLTIAGNFLFVAVGASGVDMIDIQNPEQPILISNYNTSGYASRVSANDSLIAVSDWDDVEILGYSTGELVLKGYKNTGGRTMAIALINNNIFSAEWEALNMFRYENIDGPDLDFSARKVEFARVNEGEQSRQVISVTNTGNRTLNFMGIEISNPDFIVTAGLEPLSVGENRDISITYKPSGNYWREDLLINSDDPDEGQVKIKLQGNFPTGPMPGDQAPDFALQTVNRGNEIINLESLKGGPAVIAFFTAW